MAGWREFYTNNRQWIFMLIGFLVCDLVWIANIPDAARKTLFIVLLIAFFWVFEVIPLSVTALMPLFMFPMFGILDAEVTSQSYFNDTIILFVAGFLIAKAMEDWKLHRRIALKLLIKIGNRPRLLLFGFMSITAVISMWMSNTATASLMVPLAMVTVNQLIEQTLKRNGNNEIGSDEREKLRSEREEEHTIDIPTHELETEENDENRNKSKQENKHEEQTDATEERVHIDIKTNLTEKDLENPAVKHIIQFSKAILLGVAYSSSIGGTATIVGTGTNLVFKAQFKLLFPAAPEIGFFDWFIWQFPLATIVLVLTWLILSFWFISKPKELNLSGDIYRIEYEKLGNIKLPEKVVLGVLTVMAILWATRTPVEAFPGWGGLFDNKVGDGTIGIFFSVLLFIIPSSPEPNARKILLPRAILDVEWGIMLFLGAGFAIAKAFHGSGLSKLIGSALEGIGDLPVWLILEIVVVIVICMTEVTSNNAVASIVLPILGALSSQIKQNPLIFMLPATIAASYAFMLPVSTPPNAIAFASGHLKIIEMAKAGFLLNIFCMILLPIWHLTVGMEIWGLELDELPAWAQIN